MLIRLDPNSSVPGYQQIADQIRAYLVDGQLPPGEKLPTVRSLAMDLGVHFNTVAGAYRILAEEGWISLERRRGAVVLDRKLPDPPPEETRNLQFDRLRQLIASMRASGISPDRLVAELRNISKSLEGLS